jgi:hypothetical protein
MGCVGFSVPAASAALGLGVAILLSSSGAWADPEPTLGAPEMQANLLTYYGGERTSAFVVMGLGAAGVGAGIVLATRRDDFSRGLGWPLLSLGTLETLGGIFYVFQVHSEIRRYGAWLASDPEAYRAAETIHIAGTARRFVYYRLAELALTLAGAGIATYGFVARRPTFEGIGIGGAAVGLPFLVIDTVNNGRASWYAEQLRRFQPAIGVQRIEGRTFSFVLSGSL